MAGIEDRHVSRAKKLVLDRFPEMAGTEPSLSEKRYHSKGRGKGCGSSTSSQPHGRYVLTFEKDIPLPEGHSMKRMVRVTMDESGEVVRLTSSK